METNVHKIHGAISEVKTARSNVRSLLADIIAGNDPKHKRSLDTLSKSFAQIEDTLFHLIETKTHRRHQTLQV